MHEISKRSGAKQVLVYFYGSFIRRDVMALGGFSPARVEVARLSGFDIAFRPHANIFPSSQHSIYGILVAATHEELDCLYSMDGVGIFLPEAVLVETMDGRPQPALCFIPPEMGTEPADQQYVDLIINAGREYGFPEWYLGHLVSLR